MRRSPGLCNCSLPNCLPHVMRSSMVAPLVTLVLSAAASGCSWLLEPSSSSNSCRSSGVPAEFSTAFIDSGFAGAVGTCDGWAPFRTSRHMSVDHPYAQRISSSTLMRSRATIMPAQRLPLSNCMSAAFAMSPLPCTSLAYFSNGNSFTSPSSSRHTSGYGLWRHYPVGVFRYFSVTAPSESPPTDPGVPWAYLERLGSNMQAVTWLYT